MSGVDDNLDDLADYEYEEEQQKETKGTTKADDTHVASRSTGFREFLLRAELQRAISDAGFEHPSEVQQEAIPQAVLGTDVVCQAKSGMGKTAVFVISILQRIPAKPEPGKVLCLVLGHTRELAYQICKEFDRFKKHMPDVKTAYFYGGVPVRENKEALKNDTPHIVIGTPGRVLQLVNEKALDLSHLKYFVLDECDQMLESIEMRADVQNIFKHTPHDKQVMMFSATLNDNMRGLCKKFMHNPLEIYINDGSKLTLYGLQQYYAKVAENQKNRKLVDLLDSLDFNQVVIFVSSVSRCAALAKLLTDNKFPVLSIHGAMRQPERLARYEEFKEGKARIMVCTDLFGRGIDIERVNVVIQYDMADNADTYLHRVGRAGRFGTKGLTVCFITSAEDADTLHKVEERFVVNVPELKEGVQIDQPK